MIEILEFEEEKKTKKNERRIPKITFVDVDGVLSAPKFGDCGVGMTEEKWTKWCVEYDDRAYDGCSAVPCVNRMLKERAEHGVSLYVLTAVNNSFEADAKRRFVAEKYPEVDFDGFIAVRSGSDKIPVIKAYAERVFVGVEDCELVDDDYELLIECGLAGIKATHVSNVEAEFDEEARPMRKNEVFSESAEGIAYLETTNGVEPVLITDRTMERNGKTMRWAATKRMGGEWLVEDDYGVAWRCWTKRPSELRRATTEWFME